MRPTKRQGSRDEVELNLTAMLDMAFQILAFFVLTFQPPRAEGQIALRMPPPMPVGPRTDGPLGDDPHRHDSPRFSTLMIVVTATDAGAIRQMYVGGKEGDLQELPVDPQLRSLGAMLTRLLNDPASPFDQVVIQVGSKLCYADLLKVVDVCSRQTIGGDPRHRLSKLSLVDENG